MDITKAQRCPVYFTCHAWKEDQFWYKYVIVNGDKLFQLKAGYVCRTLLKMECLYNKLLLVFSISFFFLICRRMVVKNCRREGGLKNCIKFLKMFTCTKTWWSNIIFHLLSINLYLLVCKIIICHCKNIPTGFDWGSHLITMGSPKIHLQYSEVFAIDS